MNPTTLFINPQTKQVRSPWRTLTFLALSPQLLLLASAHGQGNSSNIEPVFSVISAIAIYILWTFLLSWFCLRFFEQLNLASLGFALNQGWTRQILIGCGIGALMTIGVVGLQILGGGTRIMANQVWWRGGALDFSGLRSTAGDVLAALVLLILAALFEELTFRGYPFQTLLRGWGPLAPILFFSIFFGISHLGNPAATFFSTTNTVLAGIWFSIAYLKTRSLWFTTSMHFTWNWMMGAFFGLPVSGYRIPHQPIFASTSENPIWLTGGTYGSEGGAAATIVIVLATICIWYSKNLNQGNGGNTKQTNN